MLAKIGMMIVVGFVQFLLLAGLVLYETGIILVEVQEKDPAGYHFYVPVPVILLHAGLLVVPKDQMREVRQQVAQRRELIMGVCEQIDGSPDGSYLEYSSPDDNVSVKKEDGDLIVLVDSRTEKVRVEVPVFAVRNLVAQMTGPGL